MKYCKPFATRVADLIVPTETQATTKHWDQHKYTKQGGRKDITQHSSVSIATRCQRWPPQQFLWMRETINNASTVSTTCSTTVGTSRHSYSKSSPQAASALDKTHPRCMIGHRDQQAISSSQLSSLSLSVRRSVASWTPYPSQQDFSSRRCVASCAPCL